MKTVTQELALGYAKLNLNIHHPDLGECWREGYDAAKQELEENVNPYGSDSREHDFWGQGWWAGFYGEAPLFSENGRLTPSLTRKDNAKLTSVIPVMGAANDAEEAKKAHRRLIIKRTLQIATIIVAAAAAYELANIA